jgi:hypothetical protein
MKKMNAFKLLNEDKNLYSTSDLALAAAINLYYPIKAINKDNPKKVYFIFEKSKNLNLVIEKFWGRELKVDALLYFNSLKTLKNRIYNS